MTVRTPVYYPVLPYAIVDRQHTISVVLCTTEGTMIKQIRIRAGSVELTAELNDTRTAAAIRDTLPLSGKANLWGQEIYFSIPLEFEPEDGHETVENGDIGYWPPGAAFCIFFGATPASHGSEIRPASPVNVFGHIQGDTTALNNVASGTPVYIENVE